SNVTIPVLTNDAPQGSPIVPSTLEIVTQPQHGTVTVNTDGTVLYTPDPNYTGTDVFTYRVQDASGNWSNTATATITVTQRDTTSPVAENDATDIKKGSSVTIPVLTNDAAAEGQIDPSTVEIIAQPQHGTVIVNTDGTIVYTADASYTGADTFTYRVKDATGNWSNVATVTITVTQNDIDIPNVITPNGDGANDKLVIRGLEKYVQNEIIIFNRWNNMLYRQKNYQSEWDGQGLNAGTYYYTLKVQDVAGKWHTINGFVMLMR
ncbi:Ig-like domain-containing protein, partial [Chitinophaga tropicalis]